MRISRGNMGSPDLTHPPPPPENSNILKIYSNISYLLWVYILKYMSLNSHYRKPLPCNPPPHHPREDFSGSAYHYDIDENTSILMIVGINLIPKYNTWSKEYHNHYDVEHPHVYLDVILWWQNIHFVCLNSFQRDSEKQHFLRFFPCVISDS